MYKLYDPSWGQEKRWICAGHWLPFRLLAIGPESMR